MPRSRSLVLPLLFLSSSAIAFDTVINLPPGPLGPIGSNTQVNLLEGGVLSGLSFSGTTSNVEINLLGGTVTGDIDARPSNLVTISGGKSDGEFTRVQFTTGVLTGGDYDWIKAEQVTMTGGRWRLLSASNLSMSGGSVGELIVTGGSVAAVEAGRVGTISVRDSSTQGVIDGRLRLLGGEFRLNGQPVSGLTGLERGDVLTGVLSSGTSFVFGAGDGAVEESLELVNVGAPPVTHTVIDLATDPLPDGLRPGQTLIAHAGDDLGDAFHANQANINLGAATIGNYSKILGGVLTIDGGVVGEKFHVMQGSSVVLRDGEISEGILSSQGVNFDMQGGFLYGGASFVDSVVTIRGGAVANRRGPGFGANLSLRRTPTEVSGGSFEHVSISESQAGISGGFFESLSVGEGSDVTINGGHVRNLAARGAADVSGGKIGRLSPSSGLAFRGAFELDGVPVSGEILFPEGSVLSGVLEDGTPLAFSSQLGDEFGWTSDTINLVDAQVAPATDNVINAPFDPIPSGLREGQVLNLGPGADTGSDFVSQGGVINVVGGTLGDDAVIQGGLLVVSSGIVDPGEERQPVSGLSAIDGATVLVSGGTIRRGSPSTRALIDGASSMVVSGGEIDTQVHVTGGSSLDAVGGTMRIVVATDGSAVRVGGDAVVGAVTGYASTSPATTNAPSLVVEGGSIGSASPIGGTVTVTGGVIGSLSINHRYVDGAPVPAVATLSGGDIDTFKGNSSVDVLVEGTTTVGKLTIGDTATIRGGDVADVVAVSDGQVDLVDGASVGTLHADGGSIAMRGGVVRNEYSRVAFDYQNHAYDGGTIRLEAGAVGSGFEIESGALVEVLGGVFGGRNFADDGTEFRLVGGDFFLNGAPASGQVDPTGEYVLTGTLSDGSPFILSSATDDEFRPGTLHLVDAELPAQAAVINAPTDTVPHGLRAGQVMNLSSGAAAGDNFAAIGATLNMSGGTVGAGLELFESLATVSGGEVGNTALLYGGSSLTINGGRVGTGLQALDGAAVTLSSGQLGESAAFAPGSQFTMTGGHVGPSIEIQSDATISGGAIGRGLAVEEEGALEVQGGEFLLDGVPVAGEVTINVNQLLTGVLEDGSPFLFNTDFDHNDQVDTVAFRSVTLTETHVPAAPPVIDSATDPVPNGLRQGQTLRLRDGSTTTDDFTALGGLLEVSGGTVGVRLEALDTRIELQSGAVGENATLFEGSDLTVGGGEVGPGLHVAEGASATLLGGRMDAVSLAPEATLNIAGGDFDGQSDDLRDQDFWSPQGSTINLYGLTFEQNGVDLISGLEFGESVAITDNRTALTGVLADGAPVELPTGGRGRIIGNGDFTLTKLLQGDFNGDGLVDAADYSVWRDSKGLDVEPGSGADHDFDGRITRSDYEVWASNFGLLAADLLAESAAASVPEPAAMASAILAAISSTLLGRRFRS